MNCHNIDIIAGVLSSIIFASGTFSMLIKVVRTHDVDSYSLSSIILNNLGNLVYWLYVFSLPMGPIYFLHLFYTVAMIVMLLCFVLYHHRAKEPASNQADPFVTIELSQV